MILLAATAVLSANAQPQKRRAEQQQQRKTQSQQLSTRAQLSFPTAQTMSEDVVWRRDIYRELDLNEDANAGLYYPVDMRRTRTGAHT